MIEAVHPVLMARDVAASVAFFRKLGFTVAFADPPASPRYAVVARDGCELHLQWQDASQFEGSRDRPTYRIRVERLDEFFEDLKAAGIAPDASLPASPWAEPGDTPWGTREFHLRDPAGNGLHFYQGRGIPNDAEP